MSTARTVAELLHCVEANDTSVHFSDVISVIDENYTFTATRFSNGDTINEAGSNNGSCKIFAFAQLNALNKNATLSLFGDYYRIDVLQHPDNTDHANIRNFIIHGWQGIQFDSHALVLK